MSIPLPNDCSSLHDFSGRECPQVVFRILSRSAGTKPWTRFCSWLTLDHEKGVVIEWRRSYSSPMMNSHLGWWTTHETLYNWGTSITLSDPCCGPSHADEGSCLGMPQNVCKFAHVLVAKCSATIDVLEVFLLEASLIGMFSEFREFWDSWQLEGPKLLILVAILNFMLQAITSSRRWHMSRMLVSHVAQYWSQVSIQSSGKGWILSL